MYNGSITLNETKNKYIFWDIDGTLAPYRFNNHIADPEGTVNGMSLTEINNGCFIDRLPSHHMQNVINTCCAKRNLIMGHCLNQKEMDDKVVWLDKYYPDIKERNLTFENIPKYQTILNYCNNHNIDLKEVLFVDDVLPFLREAERHGITSYHISSFLDWTYQKDLSV